jgi:hypothetical protein
MRSSFLLSFLFAFFLLIPSQQAGASSDGGNKERNNGGDTPTNISGIIGSMTEDHARGRKKGQG